MLYRRVVMSLSLAVFLSGCGTPDLPRTGAPAAGSASSSAPQLTASPAPQLSGSAVEATPAPAGERQDLAATATLPPPLTSDPSSTPGTADQPLPQELIAQPPSGETIVEQTPPPEGGTPILPSGEGSAATAELIIVEPATAGPVLTPTPLYRTATIRMEHTMQTLELRVGDAFVLQLGDMLWQLEDVDRAVLQPVEDALGRADVQGAYQAIAPGQTVLRATGDPPCIHAQPACMMPSLLFHLTVIVHP